MARPSYSRSSFCCSSRREGNSAVPFLFSQPFTRGWFIAVGVIIAAAFWILFFAFRDLPYTRDLWWQFEFDAQAPRALRATVGVAVLAMSLALLQLLRPPRGFAERPVSATLDRAAAIIRRQDHAAAMLALMGDKSLMFSASGYAFLMFARRGRSWIALFDPVGPRTEWPELIWRFVEQADSYGGRAAFYQVRPDSLPLYLDAGLNIMKLGEEAVVQLADFDLSGAKSARLRYALGRGERDGLRLELRQPSEAPPVIDLIKAISDDWLRSHRMAEKGFSVAAFERTYLASQWVALLRQNDRPIAFATVMMSSFRHEVGIGLMRHRPGYPSAYAMEFLLTRLLLAFKEAGYQRFSLGMAPLSGINPAPLSSQWHQLGGLIWRNVSRSITSKGSGCSRRSSTPFGSTAIWPLRARSAHSWRWPTSRRSSAADTKGPSTMRAPALFFALLLVVVPARALDGGRYGEVHQALPRGPMRGLVIYFSDRGGWTDRDQAVIDALAAKGALGVGVDTDVYLAPSRRAMRAVISWSAMQKR